VAAIVVAAVSFALVAPLATGSSAGASSAVGRGRTAARPYVPGGAPTRAAVAPRGRRIDASLQVDGSTRTYHLYVPRSLPDRAVPLLVALHGGLGSGSQFEQNTDFDGLAEANGFIVVYPDGTPTGYGPGRLVWNAGGCCGRAEASRNDVDDVAFVSALIGHLESTYRIDPHRVFVTGHSNGALLAFALACQLSTTVDAIAVQAGALMEPSCHPAAPVSVMEIHGTEDQNIPINGGKGTRGVSGVTFPPPVVALETLATADGCRSPVVTGDAANRAVTIETWGSCKRMTSVEWVKVTGANHAWMGHPGTPGSVLLVGEPFMGFDSSAAVWSFLADHPRR
jgi:polyhydroxybutyrate depolymerase